MRLDLEKIRDGRDQNDILTKARAEIDKCSQDDPPLLSDIIVNVNRGGQPVMILLGDMEARAVHGGKNFLWKVQVLRDEWGNKPQPGDVVVKKTPKGLYTEGLDNEGAKPVPGTELSTAKVDGSYASRFEDHIEYPVDSKGCITCGFRDAVHFINMFGIHPETERPVRAQREKIEMSDYPKETPDNKRLHVWYWRFKEATASAHKILPEIQSSKEPRRGQSQFLIPKK